MELAYPWLLLIGIVFVVVIAIIKPRKKTQFQSGKKLANTDYAKETPYYKKILKKYRMIVNAIKTVCIITLILSLVVMSRPIKVEDTEIEMRNRDIYLCLDVSLSVAEVNKEIIKQFKDIVNNFKGERFGISIFNCSPVLMVPLTDDYNYILKTLDLLEESFTEGAKMMDFYDGKASINDYDYKKVQYITEGTTEGNNGSSLIGDGLASCIMSFNENEKYSTERTRMIIFSTDNCVSGTETITVREAAKMAKEDGIMVYCIAPSNVSKAEDLKYVSSITNGKYYEANSNNTVKSIVSDIEKTEKALLEGNSKLIQIDTPEVVFVCLIVALFVLEIIYKKVSI